jgi:arylformamidase
MERTTTPTDRYDDDWDDWIDVTVPIHDGMVHWPGDPAIKLQRVSDVARGDPATVSHLDLGVHTGTHVDAPVHFIPGAGGVDKIPLASLLGPARVLSIGRRGAITVADLERFTVQPQERILLRTPNSDRCWITDRFVEDYSYVSLAAARYLADLRVRTIGVDYLSVGGGGDGPTIHRTLLEAGVCIIEGLDLSGAVEGSYQLCCLPLRIAGSDGAPARVLLGRPRQ